VHKHLTDRAFPSIQPYLAFLAWLINAFDVDNDWLTGHRPFSHNLTEGLHDFVLDPVQPKAKFAFPGRQ
jgi:hypothetical protein